MFITCARGTSDHAAIYFKYLVETRLGMPVASIGPSVASVYQAPLRLHESACLTISQSGASPDIVALQMSARAHGARTVALVNNTSSPAATHADRVLDIMAGPERAVAATKSYICTVVALAAIFAGLAGDGELGDAMKRLPEVLREALHQDWSVALSAMNAARSHYVISRGPGLTIAAEAALKLKETCRLHAEAFSAAELRHGPIALAGESVSALVFAPDDTTRSSVLDAALELRRLGAGVFVIDAAEGVLGRLPAVAAPHPLLTPISQAVSFYKFVGELAAELGHSPDAPPYLSKITRTT